MQHAHGYFQFFFGSLCACMLGIFHQWTRKLDLTCQWLRRLSLHWTSSSPAWMVLWLESLDVPWLWSQPQTDQRTETWHVAAVHWACSSCGGSRLLYETVKRFKMAAGSWASAENYHFSAYINIQLYANASINSCPVSVFYIHTCIHTPTLKESQTMIVEECFGVPWLSSISICWTYFQQTSWTGSRWSLAAAGSIWSSDAGTTTERNLAVFTHRRSETLHVHSGWPPWCRR